MQLFVPRGKHGGKTINWHVSLFRCSVGILFGKFVWLPFLETQRESSEVTEASELQEPVLNVGLARCCARLFVETSWIHKSKVQCCANCSRVACVLRCVQVFLSVIRGLQATERVACCSVVEAGFVLHGYTN